jgi:uncharacterized damage-inducible protein DinB
MQLIKARRSMVAVAASMVLLGSSLFAQTRGTAGAATLTQDLKKGWDGAKRNLLDSAQQMPEANYAFKPVDTVRTFGQILAHVAGANYLFCSPAKGEKSPYSEDHFEKTATTRAAIIKAVQDSVAYCDSAFTGLTDARLGEKADVPFGLAATRGGALAVNTGHVNEHYGNLVTYFRLKGMVPPSSSRGGGN